jgi:transposase-like protein
MDQEKIAKGKGAAHRAGLYYCAACNGQFTVTVGTVMERSKISISKWLLAMHLMAESKKGVSALELQRMLGVTYKSAWFLAHRIREAMGDPSPSQAGGLGGKGKVVEVDETYVGGRKGNRRHGGEPASKKAVVTLVERKGHARSFHVANVDSEMVRKIVVKNASGKSVLMTDESSIYAKLGREFASHHSVDHSRYEYAYYDLTTDRTVSINVSENFYSILKRGITGVYHSLSQRGASAPLFDGVRFSLQQSFRAWGRRWRTCCADRQRYRRQAPHVPAD